MSGLEDLYKQIVIDHYRSPRNRGELETPAAKHVEGFNPLCGDVWVPDTRTWPLTRANTDRC
ncbi:MAG: NifU-like protein involved in Fe-S cluster formation [Candidatus Poriferisodalaceae bacterium]|jgi:NifU-like protein involved in Fe-S cluster formation